MLKGKDIHGLLKLPDEVIIKQLRTELGSQASYILELEDRLGIYDKMSVEELKTIKFDNKIKQKNLEISNLQKIVHKLRNDIDGLISKLASK